jgi:hypothetical protein
VSSGRLGPRRHAVGPLGSHVTAAGAKFEPGVTASDQVRPRSAAALLRDRRPAPGEQAHTGARTGPGGDGRAGLPACPMAGMPASVKTAAAESCRCRRCAATRHALASHLVPLRSRAALHRRHMPTRQRPSPRRGTRPVRRCHRGPPPWGTAATSRQVRLRNSKGDSGTDMATGRPYTRGPLVDSVLAPTQGRGYCQSMRRMIESPGTASN